MDYGDGQTQSYTFDAMGNRTQRVDSVAGTTGYTVDAANRLTTTTGAGASTYTNDADGNTLTGGGRTNTWDSQNRMVSCIITGSSSTFKYGSDGLRRQKTTNGTSTDYAYDGTMLVREGHASGGSLTATITYFQGQSGPVYRRDDTQTEQDSQGRTVTKARWYVYDGLGSVLGEVDPLGDLTSNPKYDVYGAVRANSGTATSKQGFVGNLGHLSEPETGLVYMRARYMDPNMGRFSSEDPEKEGSNWLAYCNNNPTNKVDQSGKSIGDASWWDNVGFTLETAGAAAIGRGLALCYKGDMMFNLGNFLEAFGQAGGPLCYAALAPEATAMKWKGGGTIISGLLTIIAGAELINFGAYVENNSDEFADKTSAFLSKV